MIKKDSTMLIEACKKDNYDEISKLLENQDLDVNEKDADGNTALHYIADRGNIKALPLLMKHNPIIDIQNKQGDSPLMIAVSKENIDVIKKLLESGADPNLSDNLGYTSVHNAAFKNNLEIMKILVDEYKGDINATTNQGSTVMHCVAVGITQELYDWQLATWLLKKGVSYKAIDNKGSVYDAFYSADWSYGEVFKELVLSVTGNNYQEDQSQ